MQKVLAILGPTGTGKTDLAILIAQKFNGEVVSADSRQVYRGLNLLSGKVTAEEACGIPHHMIDIADPKKSYSVSDYKKQAESVIIDIHSRGKLPIICGGTGLYADAVLYDKSIPEVPPNTTLREELDNMSLSELQNRLKLLDSNRFEKIDTKNKVRLIRAIEIASALGSVPELKTMSRYDICAIGITLPADEMKERIMKRIINRLNNGMTEEAKSLIDSGVSHERMYDLGLECRYIGLHLKGILSREQMIDELFRATVRYSKRQMTWFKKNKDIEWFDPKENERVSNLVKNFLEKK